MPQRPHASTIAFILTAALGAAITYAVHLTENGRAQARWDEQLANAASLVNDGIARDMAYLRATRSFILAYPGSLRRAPFADYVQGLNIFGTELGLQGMGFSQIITAETLPQIEAQMAEDYGHVSGVWPKSSGLPTTAIVLLEPSDERNLAPLGFDMYSDPVRREIMDRSAATKSPAMTPPLILLQEIKGDPQPGVLIYHHVPAERPDAVEGYIYSPVRVGDLVERSLSRAQIEFELLLFDRDQSEPPLYQSKGFQPLAAESHRSQLSLDVGGRVWQFEARFPANAHVFSAHRFTIITGFAMLLLAIATSLAIRAQGAATDRARELNRAQSQLMREKDLHLREMSHRMKNSLTRVVAMARQAARGAESKDDFVLSLNNRLRAMANAQDMLTRSASGATDLRALLTSELTQIGSQSDDFATLEGPKVELDARETQALGLSFHELATNALKYGAGAIEGARLTVSWTLETRVDGKLFLTLIWDEQTGRVMPQPEHKGFGSQLLDSCIRLELGGAILRSYHDKGLTVTIHVPLSPFENP